jgi:hypothetical protein
VRKPGGGSERPAELGITMGLVDETIILANRIADDIDIPAEPIQREQIKKCVENFRAHQQRLIREREAYAASVLLRMQAHHRQ